MRTTLEIAEDVLEAARAIARADGLSLGDAVSRLARKGLVDARPIDLAGPFPTFTIEYGVPAITLAQVNEHRD